jgi:hypothetical protein
MCAIYSQMPQPEESPLKAVILGETLRIPVQVKYNPELIIDDRCLPRGSRLEYVSGFCPVIAGREHLGKGLCNLNIVIPGKTLGTTIDGGLFSVYSVLGYPVPGPVLSTFSVTVAPHYLSMLEIPNQQATANQEFTYNLKSAVKYYDENTSAGQPIEGIVVPLKQDGLRFDPSSFSIIGKPNRTGIYLFKVAAKNEYGIAQATDLKIEVGINPKDKPIFKKEYSMPSALIAQKYSMNLMALLEPKAGFAETNQIAFKVVSSPTTKLGISKEDSTLLEGEVDQDVAGQEMKLELIATSNTGGDSERYTIKIPIAYDLTKRPIIKPFKLEQAAGSQMNIDLAQYINDPAYDPKLKLVLDKIEPAMPQLSISSINLIVLEGLIPDNATGKKYLITLRANNSVGGSSDPIVIPLQISVDKKQTPRFKGSNPILPMVYPGQPYSYDFVAHRDVFPEYNDAPYEIKFADDYPRPSWLKIENNELKSDLVDPEIDSDIEIHIVIENTPGGPSKEMSLPLAVMY